MATIQFEMASCWCLVTIPSLLQSPQIYIHKRVLRVVFFLVDITELDWIQGLIKQNGKQSTAKLGNWLSSMEGGARHGDSHQKTLWASVESPGHALGCHKAQKVGLNQLYLYLKGQREHSWHQLPQIKKNNKICSNGHKTYSLLSADSVPGTSHILSFVSIYPPIDFFLLL